MTLQEIARRRLLNQRIVGSQLKTPAEVVRWMGAMQAQDFAGVMWAIGLRLPGSTLPTIERAITERQIVRGWPLRRTLHFVAAEDTHWMLSLTAPRMISGAEGRRGQLGITDADLETCRQTLRKELDGAKVVTRPEMYKLLESVGVPMAGGRGIHTLWRLAAEGLTCFGPHVGKQPSFVLLDQWVARPRKLGHDEALGELAKRYFTSHGPATLYDYCWWSGLTVKDAKRGIEVCGSGLKSVEAGKELFWMGAEQVGGTIDTDGIYLLPSFDEYLVSYKDRTATLHPSHSGKINPGSNGMFMPTVISNGRVVGTWKRTIKKNGVGIAIEPFDSTNLIDPQTVQNEARIYAKFLGIDLQTA